MALSPARVVQTWIGDRLAVLPREARRTGLSAVKIRGCIALATECLLNGVNFATTSTGLNSGRCLSTDDAKSPAPWVVPASAPEDVIPTGFRTAASIVIDPKPSTVGEACTIFTAPGNWIVCRSLDAIHCMSTHGIYITWREMLALAALPREARRAGARARGTVAGAMIPAVDSVAAIVVTVHPIPALCAAARVVQSLAHLQHGLQPHVALGAQQLSDSLLRAVLVDRQQRGSTARGAGAPVCTGVAALAIRIGYPRCELICHARRAACICISHHV